MATKTEDQIVITFTPLKGGRYRCNRDRVKVKKGRTYAHKMWHTQDPRAVARLAAARLEKQAEAAEEARRRAEEERSRREAQSRLDRTHAWLRGF